MTINATNFPDTNFRAYLLSEYPSGTINNLAADCNGDSNVTIADVTVLIDCLLGGSW